jgi:hypothetical protein
VLAAHLVVFSIVIGQPNDVSVSKLSASATLWGTATVNVLEGLYDMLGSANLDTETVGDSRNRALFPDVAFGADIVQAAAHICVT